ncbi:cation:proton antiporter [Kitasatospora aureofaciens]|uniref:cation:proton antiporter n=1 Tax=Kitasatospora aureofaciens TaxID=1894 RepID=UPI001C4744E5|nr:cation:proton antiporter [Kitasatospora aureofaciens]MBV6695868.1 cation:proton antiporter [Kitasatospora aureofaciens]
MTELPYHPYELAAAAGESTTAGGVLLALAVILGTAFLCGRIAQRLRQPAVMGEIVGGVALGPSLLGLLPGHPDAALFPSEVQPYLRVLSQLGLVLFMFTVGLRFDVGHLRGVGRRVTAVSLSSVALPFALGAGLAVALYPWFDTAQLATDGRLGPALFLGAAMSITAFPVLARIIAERRMEHDPLGSLSLACAAFQDFLAWCALAVVVAVVQARSLWSLGRPALGTAVVVLVLAGLVRPGLARLLAPGRRRPLGEPWVHAVLVAGTLLTAWVTSRIGLDAVFGAFMFGAAVPRDRVEAVAPEVPERIEQAGLLLLPAFFAVTGLAVDLTGLGLRGLVVVAAVLVTACAGKFVGAVAAARFTGSTRREATVLGILLNARGLTELVILNVGHRLGVIDTRMFSAMVVMALVTTLMTGPLLARTAVRTGASAALPTPSAAPAGASRTPS